MADFKSFKVAIENKFQELVDNHKTLFLTSVPKEDLWDKYLDSFPEGYNEKHKERREYDCRYCNQFFRAAGNVVAIVDNELVSIWDVEVEHPYQIVADKLAKLVKGHAIVNMFVSENQKLGVDFNRQQTESGVIKWQHFYFKLPKAFVHTGGSSPKSIQGKIRDTKNVFKRALEEYTIEGLTLVLNLIDEKLIYRGEEFRSTVQFFLTLLSHYNTLPTKAKDNFCWQFAATKNPIASVRSTAIGRLITDVSKKVDLDKAVSMWEKMMAPENYQRPKAIFTEKMVKEAEEAITKLGYLDSLPRRFAVAEDVTVNNVLFANRDVKEVMKKSVFDELKETASGKTPSFDNLQEVSIEDFIEQILPNTEEIELLFESGNVNNLMSVIAPQNTENVKSLFKWGNNFSWAYNGDVTDSIKEKVKDAGGKVTGELRASLAWFNTDDLDLHVIEPDGNHIHFSNTRSKTSGHLDVDMNVRKENATSKAVENIIWTNKSRMLEGIYRVVVHNYTQRNSENVGFEVEIEHNNKATTFKFEKELKGRDDVMVVEFMYQKDTGIEILNSIDVNPENREVWGITTNKFHRVSMAMVSPNHWDDQGIGNKHYFFVLQNCVNPGNPRGFFNEFLNNEVMTNKRFFEALGAKLAVPEASDQLSGLGFSSTLRSTVTCRVKGKINKVLKIKF